MDGAAGRLPHSAGPARRASRATSLRRERFLLRRGRRVAASRRVHRRHARRAHPAGDPRGRAASHPGLRPDRGQGPRARRLRHRVVGHRARAGRGRVQSDGGHREPGRGGAGQRPSVPGQPAARRGAVGAARAVAGRDRPAGPVGAARDDRAARRPPARGPAPRDSPARRGQRPGRDRAPRGPRRSGSDRAPPPAARRRRARRARPRSGPPGAHERLRRRVRRAADLPGGRAEPTCRTGSAFRWRRATASSACSPWRAPTGGSRSATSGSWPISPTSPRSRSGAPVSTRSGPGPIGSWRPPRTSSCGRRSSGQWARWPPASPTTSTTYSPPSSGAPSS